ncbi:MAG: BamA/TamA family outer membrane protein [Roseinatronobacter sp.]|nr:BamA/TamA family outer membrane protein [Roseinatronobacter sp.]
MVALHRLASPRLARLGRKTAATLAAGLLLALPAQAFEALNFRFQGDDSALQTALERASLLAAARAEGVADPFELFTIARAEYGQLIGIFYEAGFYAPQISVRIDGREAADISPLAPPEAIGAIEVVLVPGPAFAFGRTELGPLASGTELPADFTAGQPARSTTIRDATLAAVDGWREHGHAKADAPSQEITARHPPGVLDVAIQIAPGPRLRFGALRPDGQQRTRPDRIVAIAGLPTGETFSPRDVQRAAERLRRTGTFASVALREADAANPDGTLDINASVVEAPLRRLGAGVEYDTEAGGKLSAFWLHRNLLGGAERFRIEGRSGGRGARRGNGLDYRLALEFARPAPFTTDTPLNLGAFVETDRDTDFNARRARIDLGLSHRYSDELTFGAGVGLLLERADFGPGFQQRGDFRLLLLPLSVEWDRRDSETAPRRGFFLQSEVKPFLGLSGTDSGARIYADLRGYRALQPEGGIVLAARAQAGAILGARLERTPRDLLFYSGGGGTVRGQPFRALGVTTAGVRSGGRGFLALSTEARIPTTETLGLAAFWDAGYVSEGAFSGAADWHAGAGLGLRYETPIGPLRIDLGLPVAGTTGRGLQLYLGLGQAF